ncbi:heme exporter protein CcmD [Photobacterium sp. WH77]|uniref:Heme exporter protein D n=1 Tax=Photobacterium arenosum TaxID=2774143 RepID=A0ABR9BHF4_9GAMM|nr:MULTISPECIES: heme exporter protein CcmD [Photobacterium]MBD8511887.1 heme exporter protein CcmD [Photobacterium arenosum]MBV7261409.1 heme exporter protein CcmD [Photobacterium sp. WH24]MCG2836962.1 heme exporter protein CcmD [Photobacterium sp. WH77]MCG2844429.1 heme exporter protein CcmD [Photobacterium sp. WH80]MDO6581639.1 heme exporter protein CcmD [Photobacterium sp. 2_MG-2023]
MHFDSFSDFLAMGGYAGYVWSAYGISALSLLILLWTSIRKSRRLAADIKNRIAREQRIKAAENLENTL